MIRIGMDKPAQKQYELISLLPFNLQIENCSGGKLRLEPGLVYAEIVGINSGEPQRLTSLRRTYHGNETLSQEIEIYTEAMQVSFVGPDESMSMAPDIVDGVYYVASSDVCLLMAKKGREDFVCPGDLLGFASTNEKLNPKKPVPTLRCLGLRNVRM